MEIRNLDRKKINTTKNKNKNFQDSFLNNLRNLNKQIKITLTNGIEITGKIISFDQYVVILEDNNEKVMIYKHAIAQIKEKLA